MSIARFHFWSRVYERNTKQSGFTLPVENLIYIDLLANARAVINWLVKPSKILEVSIARFHFWLGCEN